MIQGIAKLCENFIALLDTAVETVINAAVDRIVAAWLEAEPSALCGNPTKANEQ